MTDTSPLRWHANPDPRLRNSGDTIDGHQQRVMRLCHELAGAMQYDLTQSDLLRAARHHDDAERVLGDMPAPAKDRFPALAQAYADAEREVMAEMGLIWNLTNVEAEMLHLCDKLDAYLWAVKCGADQGEEWEMAADKLGMIAYDLGAAAYEWTLQQMAIAERAQVA